MKSGFIHLTPDLSSSHPQSTYDSHGKHLLVTYCYLFVPPTPCSKAYLLHIELGFCFKLLFMFPTVLYLPYSTSIRHTTTNPKPRTTSHQDAHHDSERLSSTPLASCHKTWITVVPHHSATCIRSNYSSLQLS